MRFTVESVLLFLLLSVGCGGGPKPSIHILPNDDVIESKDLPEDLIESKDLPFVRDTFDRDVKQTETFTETFLDAKDSSVDDGFTPNCTQAGCACTKDADCDSGFCIVTRQGMACAQECLNGQACDKGLTCMDKQGKDGQMTSICIDPFSLLCRPCKTNDDCRKPLLDIGNHCVSHGNDGSFCGVDCSINNLCPKGYSCKDVDINGTTSKQCMPKSGQCECTELFKKAAYKTNCYNENEFGKCIGERTCDSECNARKPEKEKCDGFDNNCDGNTDETNAVGCQVFYRDFDNDGYSNPAIEPSECTCGPTEKNGIKYNLSANDRKGDDCDDSNADINPGAVDLPDLAPPFTDTNCDGIDGDASRAIFVSNKGKDSESCGTQASPCKTITKGLAIAVKESRSYLLVAQGIYNEDLVLKNGVGIYGGYANSWQRNESLITEIKAKSPAGITASGIDKPTVVDFLTIRGKDGGQGQTSYAFTARDCTQALKLSNLHIIAGNGGNGQNGTPATPGNIDGNNGKDGEDGGDGGVSTCDANGGHGGIADKCKSQDGETAENGAPGGEAGHKDCSCKKKDGHNGSNGNNGDNGDDARAPNQPLGRIDSSRGWVGMSGGNGENGKNGQGGGGGGSGGSTKCKIGFNTIICRGGPGGGGGAGGCGGPGGAGGQAGGGSFGVLLINASITINDSSVNLGKAGNGGDGTKGLDGGKGGKEGDGSGPPFGCGMSTGKGGNGGDGGHGGKGGAGAGGCGGVAVGIGWQGQTPVIRHVSYSGGKAGTGGNGSGANNNGCNGQIKQTYEW